MRRREDREERPDDVEEAREARLEAEDELVEVHGLAAHVDALAEDLRARERAVHDVEVHGDGEEEDEERRQREVRDERPARGRFAEDLFDVGGEGSHVGSSLFVASDEDSDFLEGEEGAASAASPARTRSTNTSSRVDFSGVSSVRSAPRARVASTSSLRCSASRAVSLTWPFTRSAPAPRARKSARAPRKAATRRTCRPSKKSSLRLSSSIPRPSPSPRPCPCAAPPRGRT